MRTASLTSSGDAVDVEELPRKLRPSSSRTGKATVAGDVGEDGAQLFASSKSSSQRPHVSLTARRRSTSAKEPHDWGRARRSLGATASASQRTVLLSTEARAAATACRARRGTNDNRGIGVRNTSSTENEYCGAKLCVGRGGAGSACGGRWIEAGRRGVAPGVELGVERGQVAWWRPCTPVPALPQLQFGRGALGGAAFCWVVVVVVAALSAWKSRRQVAGEGTLAVTATRLGGGAVAICVGAATGAGA